MSEATTPVSAGTVFASVEPKLVDVGAPPSTAATLSFPSTAPLVTGVPLATLPTLPTVPETPLTKQEMDFRANLLNPNNDLFWTARNLIRPPVLAEALALGHHILKREGHLTQKQGGRRMSASGPSSRSEKPLPPKPAPVLPPAGVSAPGGWRAAPGVHIPPPPAGHVTKEEMDVRANQLNPNNDVFWTCRGLTRPPVLAEALAQGHALLLKEGHTTQTQGQKVRSRGKAWGTDNRRASWAGTPRGIARGRPIGFLRGERPGEFGGIDISAFPPPVMQEDVDLKANVMNPNNNAFWASRGLARPADLQEALAQGHAILEREGHKTHMQQQQQQILPGSAKWARRASLEPTHNPPMFGQWPAFVSTPGAWLMPPMAPAQSHFSREWPPFVVPYKDRRPAPPPGLELFGQQYPPFGAPFVQPPPLTSLPGFEGVVWEEEDETVPVPEQSELAEQEVKSNTGLVEISVTTTAGDKSSRQGDLDREIDTNLAQELSQVELQTAKPPAAVRAEAREERASSQAAQQ